MRALVATAVFLLAVALSFDAIAGGHLRDWPCDGCAVSLSTARAGPAPLLVLLHGDFEGAEQVLAKWEKLVAGRATILALACPAREGCRGSFWRWNGDPDWVQAQLDRMAERAAIDHERVWLAAWSGGASYVGWNTQRFEAMFSAIVLHGGGMGPRDQGCPARTADIYFLVGDRNPLHHLAVSLRDHYLACSEPVTWDRIAGADHAAEWTALERRWPALWEWLTTKRWAVRSQSD
jgi:poly(3-hydroxybutyrate) depolymerase